MVGDNGGVVMSEQEFMQYKMHQESGSNNPNRLYTSWYNPEGVCCKSVGPSSKCFCDHLYKYHDPTANPKKVPCKQAGCKCLDFSYIPVHGSQDLKCTCKHSYQAHDPAKKTCKSCPCKAFKSNWTCTCGNGYQTHQTVSEKQAQKEARGEVVAPKNGGLVAFSSILDGAERFGEGVRQEMKQKGIKATIQEFKISKGLELEEEVSAWELMQRPLGWLK